MAELKSESAVLEETDTLAEQAQPKPALCFLPEVQGRKYKAGDIIAVMAEANTGFSNSIDDVVFGGTTEDGEPFLFEEGTLQEMVNVDRFVDLAPSFIETFTYTDEHGNTKQGRTTVNQPLFYCNAEVTGYDVSGNYIMMRVKPILPGMPAPDEIKTPVEFSQIKNDLARRMNLAAFSQDDGCLCELIRAINIFKTELAIYDALHKAGKISKKLGKVSLMAKELPFASLKEAVDTINMTGRKESYRHATMADFDDIYEMVKLQLPYFPRLKPEQKEEIANNVKKAIARHDMRVLPIKGTIAFFASYNTEIPSVVSFGYRAVPGVNEALVATWALKHCLSSFRHEYNTNTFYVDAGADNSKFGRSNAVDLLEKKSGMNNYKIISGHRFYSITIESKPSEFADKSQGA